MLSFFPRGVFDEILYLIESVSEDFPSYSCKSCKATFPSLDNITKILKDSREKSNAKMNKIEDRISSLESSKEDMRQSVLVIKDEIVSSVKEYINELVDARHSELEDRKRRETNITIFNLTDHNFATGSENKLADEQDFNLLCSSLGLETPGFTNCFRLGRKTANKIRPLKVLLNSKVQRRSLLENAKYIKDKAPRNIARVIISRDLTPLQRNERKQRRQQNRQNQAPQGKNNRSVSVQDDQDPHNENVSPIAMETSHRVPSPILDMPHLNLLTHSQMGREQSDVYNDTTILHDETIIGGLLSQHGPEQPVGQIPLMGAETLESSFNPVNKANTNPAKSGNCLVVNKTVFNSLKVLYTNADCFTISKQTELGCHIQNNKPDIIANKTVFESL